MENVIILSECRHLDTCVLCENQATLLLYEDIQRRMTAFSNFGL